MISRALIASAYFPPHAGGVERYTAAVAGELRRRRWSVDIVAADRGQPPQASQVAAGTPAPGRIRAAFLDCVEIGGRLPVPPPTSRNRRILAGIAAGGYDLAIVQSHLYLSNLAVARAVADRVPTLLVGHGSGHVVAGAPLVDAGIRRYERWIAGQFRRLPLTATLGVSSGAVRWMADLGFDAHLSLGNAVAYPPMPIERTRRNDQRLNVAYVGRLEPGKGADRAIEAVLAGGRRAPAAEAPFLTIAGSGSQAGSIAAAAAAHPDQLRYLGAVTPSEVRELLLASDVFLYPSEYPEGFPTVLLEAAAAGCAVVTFPVAGAEELIQRPGEGWIVPDTAAAAKVIASLAVHPQRAARAGCELHARARATFTWERVVDRLVAAAGLPTAG